MSRTSVRYEVKIILLVTLLFIVSMWVYHGATENSFVWDSYSYLFDNENHISSLSPENLWWMTTTFELSNWHPLTWFSWAVDYQLYGGLNSWGYHFSNNVLHSINGALVFILILSVFSFIYPTSETYVIKNDNYSLIAAFLASLLFIVHPQHVESVAWVAERKDLLCQFFLLLCSLVYFKYVTAESLNRKTWYLATISLFFLAVLSKPMAVTFPAVLMLLDIFPLGRASSEKHAFISMRQQRYDDLLVEKIPFFVLSAILIVLTLLAQEPAISINADLPFIARVLNAVHSIIFYIKQFVIPLFLAPQYPYFRVSGIGDALYACGLLLILLGITVASILAWRKQKRVWLVAWLFYLGTLLPVLGIIQVGSQGAADRYVYLPTIPFYLLIAGGIFVALRKWGNLARTLLIVFFTVVISSFTIQTVKQVGVWQSDFSLWSHTVEVNADNQYAHNNLGIYYLNNADYENAAIEFEVVAEGDSMPHSTLARLAFTYMQLGRYKESIEYLVKFGVTAESLPSVEVDSNCIQYNIGWNFAHLEMYQESIDLFSRVEPDSNMGLDASLWLDVLKDSTGLNDEFFVTQDLPGACAKMIP